MEQLIIFVYDTAYCQSEADDPQKAVLFFYPNWVSEQQRLALCGQLMGAAHFCSTNFSPPRILSLQSGKFVLKKFGNYILSVGSDKTLNDWVLEGRFSCLENLVEFYHKDLTNICSSEELDHSAFMEKLSQIFAVYIPLLQYAVTSFGNVPTIWFPKTSSSVFLEAIQLLEHCRSQEGVLGGIILHHNNVLASQLDSDITKLLALSDPGKMKSTAEPVTTQFHLPVGVRMFKIYVKSHKEESLREIKEQKYLQNSEVNKSTPARRDMSRIFTVPEDDCITNVTNGVLLNKPRETPTHRSRNRHNSRSKMERNLIREKNYHNITSICVTPTVENKVIHEDLVSICAGKLETKQNVSKGVPDIVQDAIKSKIEKKEQDCKKVKTKNKISFDDLMIDTTYKSYPVPMRYYSIGLPGIGKDTEPADKKKSKLYKTHFYKTIADPMHPVFRYDGVPISLSLYNHCLDEHYKNYITANDTIDSIEEILKSKNLLKESNETKTGLNESSKDQELSFNVKTDVDGKNVKDNQKMQRSLSEKDETIKPTQKVFRKSLTLPIKPMTLDNPTDATSPTTPSYIKNKVLTATTPSTPLMTKLSLLAFEEQNKGTTNTNVTNTNNMKKVRRPSLKSQQQTDVNKTDDRTVPCLLFVCSQQNMTLTMLIESSQQHNPDLVLSLWETAFNNLGKIESSLSKSTDHLSNSNNTNTYSFLSLDPQWGTTQRYGAWGSEELKIVGSLHQNFVSSQNITEVIVRNEEAVVYGYRCGSTQTFYQQSGCSSVGLPTPADLMGVITLKARRRLERDHGVVLL